MPIVAMQVQVQVVFFFLIVSTIIHKCNSISYLYKFTTRLSQIYAYSCNLQMRRLWNYSFPNSHHSLYHYSKYCKWCNTSNKTFNTLIGFFFFTPCIDGKRLYQYRHKSENCKDDFLSGGNLCPYINTEMGSRNPILINSALTHSGIAC